VLDAIDFRFRTSDENVKIIFADADGREIDYQFHELSPDDLGLTLDDRKIRLCKNDCIFCFVRQQPNGMRRVLYLKDEDYRLSFTHGNFITLSNTSEEDIERINRAAVVTVVCVGACHRRQAPAVYAQERETRAHCPSTETAWRERITIHTQVVLCPGINDGPQLSARCLTWSNCILMLRRWRWCRWD